jgi:hypothetical protein
MAGILLNTMGSKDFTKVRKGLSIYANFEAAKGI